MAERNIFKPENIVVGLVSLLVAIIGADGERMLSAQRETNESVAHLAETVTAQGNRVTRLETRADSAEDKLLTDRLYIKNIDLRVYNLETGHRLNFQPMPSLPRSIPTNYWSTDGARTPGTILALNQVPTAINIKWP